MNKFCVCLCTYYMVYIVLWIGNGVHGAVYRSRDLFRARFEAAEAAEAARSMPEHPCGKNGVLGVCVPLPACAQVVNILKDSNTTLEGLSMLKRRACGFEGNNAKVCCPLNETVTSRMLKTGPDDEGDDDLVDAFPEPPACGNSHHWGECMYALSPVYGAKPAYRGISRWMALLGYAGDSVFWQCGGTVITERHILTAAHCIKTNLYLVRVGQIDISITNKYDGYPADYLIKRKIPHEEYTKYSNDIAVLVLQDKIQFNDYVHPICLPLPDVPYKREDHNMTGHISGWGTTETGERATHLLYAPVKNLGLETCKKAYANASKTSNLTFDERVICAGAEGVDACKGDSGGPLTWFYCTYEFVSNFQIGIVSYGYHCEHTRFAGVYTNVAHYMPWLKEKVLKSEPRGRPEKHNDDNSTMEYEEHEENDEHEDYDDIVS